MILLSQFKGYYRTENAKSKEYGEKIKFVDQRIKEVNQQKAEQDYKKELINTLISNKEKTIDELTQRLEQSESAEAELKSYIKAAKLNLDQPDQRADQERAKIQA